MNQIPKPLEIATAEEIIIRRNISRSRHRETQPAYNEPRQDTLPGASSGDQ